LRNTIITQSSRSSRRTTLVGFLQVLLLFALVIFGLTHVFVAAMFHCLTDVLLGLTHVLLFSFDVTLGHVWVLSHKWRQSRYDWCDTAMMRRGPCHAKAPK
jgi:hypothetical protein